MATHRLYYNLRAKNPNEKLDWPWCIHDGKVVHKAKLVHIRASSVTEKRIPFIKEVHGDLKSISKFVLKIDNSILTWNSNNTITYIDPIEE